MLLCTYAFYAFLMSCYALRELVKLSFQGYLKLSVNICVTLMQLGTGMLLPTVIAVAQW